MQRVFTEYASNDLNWLCLTERVGDCDAIFFDLTRKISLRSYERLTLLQSSK